MTLLAAGQSTAHSIPSQIKCRNARLVLLHLILEVLHLNMARRAVLCQLFEILLRSTVNWPQSLLSKYCKSCRVIILHLKQVVHILDKVSLNKRPGSGDVQTDTSAYFNLPSCEILA